MTEAEAPGRFEAIWRIESPKIVAALTGLVGDVGHAEDFAQEAFVAALETWPDSGVPDNPGAWLMTTAKRRAIDHLRRDDTRRRKHQDMGRELEVARDLKRPDPGAEWMEPVGDEVLRLIFMCCHPVLSAEARVALTLRLPGGLTTEEIARAFLIPGSTLQQRIVRAKRALREAHVPFEVPDTDDLQERLGSVLEVIYLVFNEGYASTSGTEWTRPKLCMEALRLGRVLAGLTPDEPEVHGLVALMEIQASRLNARVDDAGTPVLLMDQDRSRWDFLLIRRGLSALDRAIGLRAPLGPYTLQAAIAACHARARTAEETDWERIATLYDVLAQVDPSPVVELNRAVAVGRAFGPEAGLEIVEALSSEGLLESYPYLPAVRGDLLEQLGRVEEARAAFEQAARLTSNEVERSVLLDRAQADG